MVLIDDLRRSFDELEHPFPPTRCESGEAQSRCVKSAAWTRVALLPQRVREIADVSRRSVRDRVTMLPLSDGVSPRRFPIVNTAIIAANFAVWLLYELPNFDAAVAHASFYACTVDGSCHGPEPSGISWLTSIFLHGS